MVTVGSIEAPIGNLDEGIVIGKSLAPVQVEDVKQVAVGKRKLHAGIDPK